MSLPREPSKVRLIYSIMGIDEAAVDRAFAVLANHFGPACAQSRTIPFDRTDYYEPEMGGGLVRRFVAFRKLISMERLPGIKLWSNEIEKQAAVESRRTINLDPGYISAERLVLATGKNFTHRIYLGSGIFADLTLMFHKKSFRTFEWTYPDYAENEVISFMNELRRGYLEQLKEESRNP